MTWFGNSLNNKFTFATIIGFLVSSLVFLGLFFVFYQNELEHERAQAARDVNLLLQSSLENAMLKRDLDGLIFIVSRLGKQPNINRVMITNPVGEVRFSSHPEYKGLKLDSKFIQDPFPQSHFIQDESGIEVLRSIKPVHNKPQCLECHGRVEDKPINGILVVDYDATSIRYQVRNTTLLLMGAGALIVIINLIGGWWFIRRFILKPVESLSATSHSLAHGQLDTRVNLPGNDELSVLGNNFNLMARNLQVNMQELKEERKFLQSVVDAIPDGLRIIDDKYNTVLVNKAFSKQTGSKENSHTGEKCYQAVYSQDSPCPAELITCPLEEILKDDKPLKVVHQHKCCDGKVLDVEIFAAPMKVIKEGKEKILLVESIRDLSQQVRFTHEQRLSELGHLAACVAHEIYNPMSSMKLALHTLSGMCQSKDMSSEMSNYLNIVEQEMEQCILITDRLLRLSAAPIGKNELVDVRIAVEDILGLIKWDTEKLSINVVENYIEDPLRVFASESEMRMIILNLVQNAFHAMPSGGTLKITGKIEDDNVVLYFRDNGIGISTKNLLKVFQPFFSRRADNVHGTGLGLPISRNIVQSFNGTLEVESIEGEGSCFILKIPAASAQRITS
ncbi:MAG: ATP-binding protein [Pseudomonadota bacterium]